jgi:hypothetical protein
MSVPAPTPPSPVAAPTASSTPVATAWGPKAASVIGPITIKSSTGKYMFFDTVDQQAIATTFDVSLSDTPQLFLFGSTISNIQKFPNNVGVPVLGPLFPAYVQTDGSLWSYASSGYNTTTGANTTGEKHMILAPFTQSSKNWNTPYSQSFGWNFWANADGTYKIQNQVAGYTSISTDGTKVLLGGPNIESWTIEYVSYPPPPPPEPSPLSAPSPASDDMMWIWIGAGIGILFLFIILIVVIMSSKKSRPRGK